MVGGQVDVERGDERPAPDALRVLDDRLLEQDDVAPVAELARACSASRGPAAPRIVTSASHEPDSPPVARFELAVAIARVDIAPTVISPSKSDTVRSVELAEAAPCVDAVARARAHEAPVVTIVSP